MIGKLLISLMLIILGTTSAFTAPQRQLSEITAKPIPPGFHFQTPTAEINKWIATSNTKAMRRHAWDIWSGITADSGEIYEGKQLPIWETWYGLNDVFSSGHGNVSSAAASAFLASHRGPLRVFSVISRISIALV